MHLFSVPSAFGRWATTTSADNSLLAKGGSTTVKGRDEDNGVVLLQLCLQMPSAGGNRKQAGEGSVGIGEACATAKLAPAEPHVISQSVSLTSTSTPGLLQWPAHQGKRLRCCNSAQLGRGTGLVLIVCHFPPFAGRPFLGRWKRPAHFVTEEWRRFPKHFPIQLARSHPQTKSEWKRLQAQGNAMVQRYSHRIVLHKELRPLR